MKIEILFTSYVDILTDWVKTSVSVKTRQVEQSGEFRKSRYFTVMQPLQPGKDNTCDDIQYIIIQSYHYNYYQLLLFFNSFVSIYAFFAPAGA